jgi:ectoine hydroxylase-related dioxygenase (phytanoyl-CoA dioxygenase family)
VVAVAVVREGVGALTAEQRLFFEANGYLVLPEALSAEELGVLQEAADRSEDEWSADLSRPGWRRESIRQIPNIIEYDDSLLNLLEHPVVFPAVRELLGADIALLFSDYYISPPRTESHISWHEDAGLMGVFHPLSTMYVKAFFLLSDVGPEGGATALIPGSHKFFDSVDLPEPEDPSQMPGHVRMAYPAGTVWLFHTRCFHAALPNNSDITRKVLIYTYGHCWMKPWDGYEPSPELQAKAKNDTMRQLLHMTEAYNSDYTIRRKPRIGGTTGRKDDTIA